MGQLTLGDILITKEDWDKFKSLFTAAFRSKIAPEIIEEVMMIANIEIYFYAASEQALQRRRPLNSRLGSKNNIRVTGGFKNKDEFEYNCMDITRPQRPVKKKCEWKEDIFLIDLVSGTIDGDDVDGDNGVIPNIFNSQDYPWSRPNHREYKQKMLAFLESDDCSNIFKDVIGSDSKVQGYVKQKDYERLYKLWQQWKKQKGEKKK